MNYERSEWAEQAGIWHDVHGMPWKQTDHDIHGYAYFSKELLETDNSAQMIESMADSFVEGMAAAGASGPMKKLGEHANKLASQLARISSRKASDYLGIDPETRYQGFTNDRGQITLSGHDVRGPQTVTAGKLEYANFSWVDVNGSWAKLVGSGPSEALTPS